MDFCFGSKMSLKAVIEWSKFMLAGLLPAHKSNDIVEVAHMLDATCKKPHFQSATECTASVHTLHMSKPVM